MTNDPTLGDRDAPPPMPRWVKLFLIVGVILLLLVLILLLTGGHGPGDHAPRNAGRSCFGSRPMRSRKPGLAVSVS